MTDEFENKKQIKETDLGDSSAPDFGALKLLEEKPVAVNAESAKSLGSLLGQIELTDGKAGKESMADFKAGSILETYEDVNRPLSRTENLLSQSLESAINSKKGIDQIQNVLATLMENPRSVDRVLSNLRDRISQQNPLNSLSWEQGRDNNGQSFLRLHLDQRNHWGKNAGGTEVTIGSDGRNSSAYRKEWNSPPTSMSPDEGLRQFQRSPYQEPYYNKIPFKSTAVKI